MRALILRDRPLRLLYTAAGNDRAPKDYSVVSARHNNGPFKANFSLGNLKLEPVLATAQQSVNCSKIEALINSYAAAHGFGEGTSTKRRSDGTQKSSQWDATVSIQRHKEFEPAIILLSGKIFFVLYNLAFPNEVSVKLTMTEYTLCIANQYEIMSGSKIQSGAQFRYPSLSTNEMMINLVKGASGEMIGLCRDQSNIIMSQPEYHFNGHGWKEMSVYIKGKFTIEVTFHNFLESCSGAVLNCRKVLMETVVSDLMIVTGDDKEVPCHRSFLAANSPVLKAMLESDMLEARSGRIEMSDISEEGAKAFLAYVYCRDLDKPKEVSSVAFELFNAAEKYDMASLKADMKTIFLGMSSSWWKVEIALQMYFFAEKLCDGEELKSKALQVLKSNFTDVMNSDCYKNLFRDDAEAAMEFCNDLINFKCDR